MDPGVRGAELLLVSRYLASYVPVPGSNPSQPRRVHHLADAF
jgi:hypothetical protein